MYHGLFFLQHSRVKASMLESRENVSKLGSGGDAREVYRLLSQKAPQSVCSLAGIYFHNSKDGCRN